MDINPDLQLNHGFFLHMPKTSDFTVQIYKPIIDGKLEFMFIISFWPWYNYAPKYRFSIYIYHSNEKSLTIERQFDMMPSSEKMWRTHISEGHLVCYNTCNVVVGMEHLLDLLEGSITESELIFVLNTIIAEYESFNYSPSIGPKNACA